MEREGKKNEMETFFFSNLALKKLGKREGW